MSASPPQTGDSILNILGWIVLAILGLDGIREVIAYVGWVPPDKGWISNLFYGKRDKRLIKQVLLDLGYTKAQAENIVLGMSKGALQRIDNATPNYQYKKLIEIIRGCTINTVDLQYGSTRTNYYIHTMMASQNRTTREDMRNLLIYLIRKKYKKLDFLIVPKSGNPLLGHSVASSLRAQCIFHKSENERSRASDPDGNSNASNPELDLEINFEGAHFLDRKKALQGIVLDCNTSGGTQLLQAAKEFNEAIAKENGSIKIKAITDIFTLFRVDDVHKDVDGKFAHEGFTLHRFFDLNESLKETIYGINPSDIDVDANNCPCLDSIITTLKSQGLLKLDESKRGKGTDALANQGSLTTDMSTSTSGKNKKGKGAA